MCWVNADAAGQSCYWTGCCFGSLEDAGDANLILKLLPAGVSLKLLDECRLIFVEEKSKL